MQPRLVVYQVWESPCAHLQVQCLLYMMIVPGSPYMGFCLLSIQHVHCECLKVMCTPLHSTGNTDRKFSNVSMVDMMLLVLYLAYVRDLPTTDHCRSQNSNNMWSGNKTHTKLPVSLPPTHTHTHTPQTHAQDMR